ncbi:MAG: OmcA/MtrC family decaheme c-type cytochrome [Myxococcales bacterium]|nr:OmcA/MtrC family decaheme c-type cytochrome [Myxococcales bacterium]
MRTARRLMFLICCAALVTACEGPAGERGPAGDAGPPGPQGDPGPQGNDGERGPQGEAGDPGERGPEGGAGPEGEAGPEGDPGAEGPEGPAGPQGDPGADGVDGQDGTDGRSSLYTDYGLNAAIDSVLVDDEGHPVIEFTLTDDAGRPLDVEGLYTQGPISLAFLLASHTDEGLRSLIVREARAGDVVVEQATSESNGTLEGGAFGTYRYVYNAALPDDVADDAWFRVGIGARRSFDDGSRAGVSTTLEFRVDGGEDAVVPAALTDNCNSCHQGIEGHGGRWTQTDACVTCHNPQTTDPDSGNTVDFRVMIHRIHMGANLPSVQAGEAYQIIGNRGSVHDFSNIHLPRSPSQCAACHGADEAAWPTPSYASCVACHDRTSFEAVTPAGFTRHTAGPRAEDTCSGCHPAAGTPTGLFELHQPVTADPNLGVAGLEFIIDGVDGATPGAAPTLRFHVVDGAGNPVALNQLNSMEATIAGPTTAIAWAQTTRNVHQSAQPVAGGYAVTLSAIPADATGSIAVGMAGYRYLPYGAAAADSVARENGGNPVVYVSLGAGPAVAARHEVDKDLCNGCHGDLSAHGTFRNELPYCQTCHNLNATDAARRPAEALPAASITFGPMVHRIHAGAEVSQPAVYYGFGGAVDFGGVHYPGDLANCTACHVGDAWQAPNTRACTSCHDGDAARAHAALETAPDGTEACSVCHGPGRDQAVGAVHGAR